MHVPEFEINRHDRVCVSGLGLCVVSTFLWSVDQELLFILPLSTNLPEVLYIIRPIVYKSYIQLQVTGRIF